MTKPTGNSVRPLLAAALYAGVEDAEILRDAIAARETRLLALSQGNIKLAQQVEENEAAMLRELDRRRQDGDSYGYASRWEH